MEDIKKTEASNDIAEVRCFDMCDLFSHTQEPSLGDGHVSPIKYTWDLDGEIVPEHVELMKIFLQKVVTDNLIK